MSISVLKADGTTEYFKIEKLRRSLRRAGANNQEIVTVIEAVESHLYDGIKTQEIYRFAFERLRQEGIPAATRYSLRRALFGLGPTGFPFERFLGRMFKAEGYNTETGIIISGHCATHEIDIAAYKSDHSFIGEAKFHARPGMKSDLQVALYSYARLLDLRDARICVDDVCGVKEFWLITNTKFTTSAEKYGLCVGLKMLSWDFPRKNNLHDRIERAKVYPITVLHTLTPSQISTLFEHDVILCSEIINNPHYLHTLHINEVKAQEIIIEANNIINNNSTST
ncbi:hypothetical protein A2592_00675 [Candidatus Kaiserbacteria bacterium RIFOXYD1_FULL_42_15]|uniref:ATP-cone domain-containing protein n=1 Tax=Candidatus Kaiserbacteria bacterium RIFOXYD1_FULL_42_15 TaxID=1798532 RepID=A0A1F6FR23_9BACT|nr:MAG: hypothetical protein A2592_00675 [Candidatus Kaiserbacteria bacterium RIFOXYD1_FULL_42_15]